MDVVEETCHSLRYLGIFFMLACSKASCFSSISCCRFSISLLICLPEGDKACTDVYFS